MTETLCASFERFGKLLDLLRGRPGTPETAPIFSAVGYYFGKELVTLLGTPIGMVNTAWGGKPSEAFTSLEKLDATPSAKRLMEELAIAENRRIRGLGSRQREALLDRFS